MSRYLCLSAPVYHYKGYSITAIQPDQIETIRIWRNEQMDILRQDKPLSCRDQEHYFESVIWPSLHEKQPKQIIFAIKHNDAFIGYGGLVHISWRDLRAEVSFLLATELMKNHELYTTTFHSFLNLMKRVAFGELHFHKLTTEIFGFREEHIALVETNGFILEGQLKEHIYLHHRFWDSLIHGYLSSYGWD
jgi:RimJ/RimL family protein N-acetyltransferase